MVGIVIVAHTPVASAMLGFAEHAFGVLPERVRAVDIPPYEDTKASFDRVLKAAYGVNTGNGVLILTDVMGATPANVATKLESLGPLSGLNAPVVVLAGLNLPMLMRCISHRGEGLEELAKKASKDPGSGANGGDLDWANPSSQPLTLALRWRAPWRRARCGPCRAAAPSAPPAPWPCCGAGCGRPGIRPRYRSECG